MAIGVWVAGGGGSGVGNSLAAFNTMGIKLIATGDGVAVVIMATAAKPFDT